jgi:hypothetical protein
MSDITTLATALVLGFLHALEIDHMLAVTTFVSRRPALATAAGFGLRWGLGHSLAVLALGGILLATGIQWPDRWTSYGEAAVGTCWWVSASGRSARPATYIFIRPRSMVITCTCTLTPVDRRTKDRRSQGPRPPRASPPPSPSWARHHPGWSCPWSCWNERSRCFGSRDHGRTRGVGIGYLVAFGVGVTVAMTLFALGTAVAMRQADFRKLGLGRKVSGGVGVAGVLVGAWWIMRAMT